MASKLGKLVDEDGPDGLGCAPALPDYTAKLCMDQKLYFQYFVQDDVEDGTLMDTKIPIDEVGVRCHSYITSAKGIGGWVGKSPFFLAGMCTSSA